jgi:Rrf2 family protein
VNLTKSSRYALLAVLEMAEAGDGLVSAADVARRHGAPEAVVAKVLQRLVRAGLAVGTRGSNGGYRLAREASRITVLDVLQVFEEKLSKAALAKPATPLDRLMAEVGEGARYTFASVSLETLRGQE